MSMKVHGGYLLHHDDAGRLVAITAPNDQETALEQPIPADSQTYQELLVEIDGLAALDRGEGVDFDAVMAEVEDIIQYHEKMHALRVAIQVGLDDVRAGRFSTRTIDEIADDVCREIDREDEEDGSQ